MIDDNADVMQIAVNRKPSPPCEQHTPMNDDHFVRPSTGHLGLAGGKATVRIPANIAYQGSSHSPLS